MHLFDIATSHIATTGKGKLYWWNGKMVCCLFNRQRLFYLANASGVLYSPSLVLFGLWNGMEIYTTHPKYVCAFLLSLPFLSVYLRHWTDAQWLDVVKVGRHSVLYIVRIVIDSATKWNWRNERSNLARRCLVHWSWTCLVLFELQM